MAVVKTLPKTEDGRGMDCKMPDATYHISHNTSKIKNAFTLWKVVSGGYEKLASADMPQELEQKIGLGVFPEEASDKPRKRSARK